MWSLTGEPGDSWEPEPHPDLYNDGLPKGTLGEYDPWEHWPEDSYRCHPMYMMWLNRYWDELPAIEF
jgi:hypothetical protein